MKTLLALAAAMVLVGCGSSTGGTGGGSGGGTGGGAAGGAGGGAAGGSGGGGGGSAGVALTVAECETDMEKFAAQNCADKANWTAAKTAVCAKIPNATSALCAPSLVKAKTCHAQFQSATMFCQLGVTDTTEVCAVDLLLGVFCVAAINNINCASTPCSSSTDCGTNYNCNDNTGKCFNSSAACIGLPCLSSTDCPTNETCNTAAGQCVKI